MAALVQHDVHPHRRDGHTDHDERAGQRLGDQQREPHRLQREEDGHDQEASVHPAMVRTR
jgi:hypothetical protein